MENKIFNTNKKFSPLSKRSFPYGIIERIFVLILLFSLFSSITLNAANPKYKNTTHKTDEIKFVQPELFFIIQNDIINPEWADKETGSSFQINNDSFKRKIRIFNTIVICLTNSKTRQYFHKKIGFSFHFFSVPLYLIIRKISI